MNAEAFGAASPGRLVRVDSAGEAFVPNVLPPDLVWDGRLARLLSEAGHALGELKTLARFLPNPYLFTRPFVVREAVLSSQIEGTQASISDVYALEAQAALFPQGEQRADAEEVSNYVRALEHGLRSELPISARLLREMHALLMSGVRGQHRQPGEFRRSQNWIGPPGAERRDATYVPPPPGDELREAISALERFIHADNDLPPLIEIALIHYQFEAIHPFVDGNGRIGRLLITLLLLQRGLLSQPLLYLSAYFERHRGSYYDLLLGVTLRGEWRQWLDFFLRGVALEARDATVRAQHLLDLRENWRKTYQQGRVSGTLLSALDVLFSAPVLTVRQLEAHLEVSYTSAQKIIERLESGGILEEVSGKQRNRIYRAPAIFAILDAQELRAEVPDRGSAVETITGGE
ncbi:Fic family protein [Deinococcus psychrotolerans]|uniref:Fic family protein n=1 Tax=Deinococcus psychrotolerans TaxID=2489213 RepID=A0A3G8YP75_9DEIO|nr:Fic/DOC family N-terminal domain-containing protein [Deinococcus psychrotolerans]AZI43431.1 Fic family protein [Deinococcus psychrotolerans]